MSSEVQDTAQEQKEIVSTNDPTDGAPPRLQGNMGVPQLLFIVLAFNAPLGVTAGIIPLVIGFGAGIGTPLLFVALGLLMTVFAVGYTAMARMLPRAGAFYTFVTAGLGRPMGLAVSFVALMAYTVGLAYTLPFLGISLEALITSFNGPDIAWWVWALAFACGIAVLGFLRVDFSARVLAVLVAFEVAVVLVYDAVVVATGGATGHLTFTSFNPASLSTGGVAVGLAFAIMCFAGFESTAIFRDEVRDPRRTVPVATYLAVATIAVFYAVGSWLIIQAYGEPDAVSTIAADPGSAFLSNVHEYLGLVVFDIATVLLVTSGFASLTALHNVIARYVFNLGSDGILPRALGTPHPRLGSPHRASAVLSVVTIGFVVVAAVTAAAPEAIYTTLAGIAGYALVFLMFLASLGIAAYLVRNRASGESVWHRVIAPVTAAVAMTGGITVATMNLDLLTGSRSLSMVAIGVMLGCVVIGCSVALVFRALRPDTYRRIGTRE